MRWKGVWVVLLLVVGVQTTLEVVEFCSLPESNAACLSVCCKRTTRTTSIATEGNENSSRPLGVVVVLVVVVVVYPRGCQADI